MMMWVLPGIFAVTGVNFPIGVFIYWLNSNVWAMCQQFFIIRNMPAPGTEAAKAYEERMKRKGKWVEPKKETPAASAEPRVGQRQQPKRKSRQQRGGGAIAGPKGTTPNKPKPKPASGGGSGDGKPDSGGKKIPGPKGGQKKRNGNEK